MISFLFANFAGKTMRHKISSFFLIAFLIVVAIPVAAAGNVFYTSTVFKGKVLDTQKFNQYVSKFKGTRIVFDRSYKLSSRETNSARKTVYDGLLIKSGITYDGNGHTIDCGNSSNVFNTMNDENNQTIVNGFSIKNFKFVRAKKDTTSIRFQGSTLLLGRVADCTISNCTFNRWKGTAISIAYIYDSKMSKHILGYSKNVTISGCTLDGGENYNSGNGINIISGYDVRVSTCQFENINPPVWPGPIDIEAEVEGSSLDEIYVDNCSFVNSGHLAPVSVSGNGINSHGKVYITNCTVSGAEMAVSVQGSPCGYVYVQNMKADGLRRFATIANTTVNVEVSQSSFTASKNMISNDNVIQKSNGSVSITSCTFRDFKGTINGWGSVGYIVSANKLSLDGNQFYDCFDKNGKAVGFAVNKQSGLVVNVSSKNNVYNGGTPVE